MLAAVPAVMSAKVATMPPAMVAPVRAVKVPAVGVVAPMGVLSMEPAVMAAALCGLMTSVPLHSNNMRPPCGTTTPAPLGVLTVRAKLPEVKLAMK